MIIQTCSGSLNFGRNGVSLGGPFEASWILIRPVDIVHDGLDQLRNVSENAPTKSFVCEIAKPSFNHVQPGTGCRNKVNMKTRMLLQPRLNLLVFVCAIVVSDEMQLKLLWCFLIDECPASSINSP